MKKPILAGISLLVGGSLWLAACTAQPTPTVPATIDPNVIYTQAAQTVQAGIEQAPTRPPTNTPEPTQTVAPTNTIDPTTAAGLTATVAAGNQAAQTPGVETTPDAGTTPLVIPTATSAVAAPPPAASSGDKCEWVDNKPKDNTQVRKNSDFDAAIVIKNTGTTTWNEQYALRYYAGERMGVPTDYYIQSSVAPGQLYTFEFVMKSPNSTGMKEVLMVVQNPTGFNMCWINIPLEIIN